MVTFLLLLVLVMQLILLSETKRFRKSVVFHMQEMHIRLSEKQDRLPRSREERDHAVIVDSKSKERYE